MVTYGYFFEATLSAKGGSYAQFAALNWKGTVNDQEEVVSFKQQWDLYFLSGCGIAKAQMSAFWVKVT